MEEDAGSCIDQASPYESPPPMCPCTGLDFPPTQITRREKVSPIEITHGDFAGESTIVVAMNMKVHGGTPCAMHKSNASVGQMEGVSSHKIIYASHQQLHFGGLCGNCNLLAKASKCLNGRKEETPILKASDDGKGCSQLAGRRPFPSFRSLDTQQIRFLYLERERHILVVAQVEPCANGAIISLHTCLHKA